MADSVMVVDGARSTRPGSCRRWPDDDWRTKARCRWLGGNGGVKEAKKVKVVEQAGELLVATMEEAR